MKELLKPRAQNAVSSVLGMYFDDFEIEKGKDCYLFDRQGNKYLDFAAGIACCIIGHCHPKVVAAISAQSKKLLHVCIGVAYYEPYVALAEEIKKISPIKDSRVFLCQSGSEAVEAALKLAKYASKKPGIIAFQGGFHGRTLGALSATTSKMKYREGYEPLLPEFHIAQTREDSVDAVIKANPGKIAAIIIEPILGEGGYRCVETEFLRYLRRVCDQNGILLIFDEVQTGIGHTGKWFACEHAGTVPDIISAAKGIASGLPLGACIAGKEVMEKWSPGAHGSTFGGNPISCAAAIATLKVIKSEKLLARAAKQGDYLMKKLSELQTQYPQLIKEVRGKGLMIGVDFGANEFVKKIMNYCLENKLVLISTGGDGTVIRFIPAINISRPQIDKALKIFASALAHV